MTEKKLNLYTSLFFFLVFIPVLTLLVPTVKWAETRPVLLFSIMGYLILCYIILTRYNIPGLFIRHHYVRGTVLSALALGVTAAFSRLADWLNLYEFPGEAPRTTHIYSTVWFLFLVILGYSFFNNMLQEAGRLARQREEMEAQRDKAELAMYKAQINPHFLFNTLNTLYGLILTDSDKREEAFEKFINMMKYTYSNANRDYISLQEEMDYLQQYVDLQLLRLGGATRVRTNFHVDDPHMSIAPMLLITLVRHIVDRRQLHRHRPYGAPPCAPLHGAQLAHQQRREGVVRQRSRQPAPPPRPALSRQLHPPPPAGQGRVYGEGEY